MQNYQDLKYNQPVSDHEYEVCADCGKQTDVKTDTDITLRKCYVYDAGQFCRNCWTELYGKTGECEDSIM